MKSPRLTLALGTLVGGLLLAAGPAAAQTPQMPKTPQAPLRSPAQQIPDSVRQMLMELQQIRQQLAAIQAQTLQANDELRTKQHAAEEAVKAAMIKVNPAIEESLTRLEGLGDELRDAKAQQDTARMRQLLMEGQRTRQDVQLAQNEVMKQQAIADQVGAYRDDLLEAMKAHDPQTNDLLTKMDELTGRLEAAAKP